MCFNWKTALAEKANNPLEILKNFELIVDMAEDDVRRILRKTNFDFVANSENFEDIYRTVCSDISERKLDKWLKALKNNEKKGISLCLNSSDTIQWIISRIANEIKNLFDKRYRGSINVTAAVRADINTLTSDDIIINKLQKLNRMTLVKGIMEVWQQGLDLEEVEHLCARFGIEKFEIFKEETASYIIFSDNKCRQLSFNFELIGSVA